MDKIRIHRLTAIVIIYTLCGCLGLMLVNSGFAQSSKKNKGLNFQVPDDWPIEERGGLLGPIPTDEYIVMKFEKTEKEFSAIKSDLTEKFEAITESLENVKTSISQEIKQVKSEVTQQKSSGGGDVAEILIRLEKVEKQIARVDQKISNKAAALKGHIEAVARDLKNVKTQIDGYHSQAYLSEPEK